ncbi:recombinase family protein [Proteiniclasticum ruminis]|uniref:Site-specific DNA recombinase n=1 Tax=Proteiniclasticum ruminis TaxID=398199 RepID=A0A1I5BB17_9CLOT|nr:recombinase family protein [Proteiniclasticum ruminis]SFN71904.1 Site-specific DNA recombinase [Proteiniclasticum ruminis]
MVFGYIRVSSKEQNEGRQIKALRDYCNELKEEHIYIDKQSGKDFERTQYQELKKLLRAEDIVLIKELDRLGRNKDMIKQELKELQDKKVRVKILNIPTTLIDFDKNQAWLLDMVNNILIEVLGAIAEEERNKIRQRQAEGIALAKEKGKYKGRDKGTFKADLKKFSKIYKQVEAGYITINQAIELLGYKSRTSYYNMAKQYEAME